MCEVRHYMAKENVLIVYFKTESEAFQAFTEICQNAFSREKDILIEQASLIKRENGNIIGKDHFTNEQKKSEGAVIGSIIGSFIGLLGGPIGVLLGLGVGASIGTLPSIDEEEENAGILHSVTSRLQDNDVAIVAVIQEEDETKLDEYFSKFETMIVRYDAHVIEEEIEYAEELQEELAYQARIQMKHERSEERKHRVEEKRAHIRARFEALREKLKSST